MDQNACLLCHFTTISFNLLIRHVIRYHKDDPKFKIKCVLKGCGATFKKWRVFKRHILLNHRLHANIIEEFNYNQQNEGDHENEEDNAEIGMVNQLESMQLKLAQFVVNMRETYRISGVAITEMTDGLIDILEFFSNTILNEIRGRMDINTGLINFRLISEIFEELNTTEIFSTIKTKYLLDKLLIEKFGMILPQKIKVGCSYRWIKKKEAPFVDLVEVEDHAMLIPFLSSLEKLLSNHQVRENIENPRDSENGLLKTVLDGSYYKDNEFFKNNEHSLAIIIYIDELGIANPLGVSSRKEKLYMMYWTIANLHPEFRSKLDVVQLLGIVKSKIVKRHGLLNVLKPFLSEVQIFKTKGIKMTIDNEQKTFKGSVIFAAGDTPAAAEMGGFKMSVSAHRPCRTCFTTNTEWKTNFNEKNFKLRDATTHQDHVEAVSEPNLTSQLQQFWQRRYGVNGPSPLSEIQTFDVTKCFPQDVMHVLILGVVEIEIRYLIFEAELFTLDDLNSRMSNFDFNHFKVNKPACIFPEHIQEGGSLKQSASQMFGLAHCLPFLIAEWTYLQDNAEVKKRIFCHVRLLQILNVCLAYEIHNETLDLLSRMIEVFILEFNIVFIQTRLFQSSTS